MKFANVSRHYVVSLSLSLYIYVCVGRSAYQRVIP